VIVARGSKFLYQLKERRFVSFVYLLRKGTVFYLREDFGLRHDGPQNVFLFLSDCMLVFVLKTTDEYRRPMAKQKRTD
jgi:hypothetical protein